MRRYRCDMKTQALNVSLTGPLHRFVEDQVESGRYPNPEEVVRDALRQMQQREIEQFARIFDDYPGAPKGEPTRQDDEMIRTAIKRHRRKG
jgi:putative addiction module CopG family antidote